MKKFCAFLLAVLLAGVKAIGQPSLLPASVPLPPGMSRMALAPTMVASAVPLAIVQIPFGSPPFLVLNETQVFKWVTNFSLPSNTFVRTPLSVINASNWNATIGQRLKVIGVNIAGVPTNSVNVLSAPLVPEAVRSLCIACWFDLGGGVGDFEVSMHGEIDNAWISESAHLRYNTIAIAHGQPDTSFWKIKFVNLVPRYALDGDRVRMLRAWMEADP